MFYQLIVPAGRSKNLAAVMQLSCRLSVLPSSRIVSYCRPGTPVNILFVLQRWNDEMTIDDYVSCC